MYVLIRTDLPLADQIVQVGHACLDAGFQFQKPNEVMHLIVLGVDSESHLLESLEKISLNGIRFVAFYEPDNQFGYTAACTEPLKVMYRREFRDFTLWKERGDKDKT